MIYHVGAHGGGNAGDLVIMHAMNKLFENYELSPIVDWHITTDATIERYNKSQGLLIGGGGLLLCDTKPNDNSGWRWNITVEQIKQIKVPIVVFGIGFNRFRGQEDYKPVFREHISQLVDQSKLFTMRERFVLDSYVKHPKKVLFQPDPAALLNKLFTVEAEKKDELLLFAPAYDRPEMRYKNSELVEVGRLLKRLSKKYDVRIVLHISKDKKVLECLPGFKTIDLIGKPPEMIMETYKSASCVIGMRLHSCVIPFGLGTKFIPLISHDKLYEFLKVIGFPSFGVEITDADFVKKLEAKIEEEFDYEGIELAQDYLYQVTQANMQKIRKIFEVTNV